MNVWLLLVLGEGGSLFFDSIFCLHHDPAIECSVGDKKGARHSYPGQKRYEANVAENIHCF